MSLCLSHPAQDHPVMFEVGLSRHLTGLLVEGMVTEASLPPSRWFEHSVVSFPQERARATQSMCHVDCSCPDSTATT